MVFKIPYVYDFITKLCRQQAEVIQNHENECLQHMTRRKYKRLNLGGGQAYKPSSN
jgi:hypothetical protein